MISHSQILPALKGRRLYEVSVTRGSNFGGLRILLTEGFTHLANFPAERGLCHGGTYI